MTGDATEAAFGAYVDAAAAVLQLPIAPDHRSGVVHYFALAAQMAALLDAEPLLLTDDPAEAFVPISPRGAVT